MKRFLIIGIIFVLVGVIFKYLPPILDYKYNKETQNVVQTYHLKGSSVNEGSPIGVLSIPSVSIKEPIYHGPATNKNLKKGLTLASESDSINDYNIAIAGHRVEGRHIQFNDLPNVAINDNIYLDLHHIIRRFKVTDIKHVKPNDISVLDETSDHRLTLITCDNYNNGEWQKRLIVIAKEVN